MASHHSTIRSSIPLALTCLLASIAQAQTPARQDELFFDTVDVNVVNVEVIVTDKDGVPIVGLGPADFEILEDGEPMQLSNFFAVEGRQAVRAGVDGIEPPDAATGPETQLLNLIVFVDDFNLVPQNRNLIFKNLRKYLAEDLDPRDQVMLVRFDGDVEIAQPFTNDAALLAKSLDLIETNQGPYAIFAAQRTHILSGIDATPLFGQDNEGGSLQSSRTPQPANRNDFDQTEMSARSLIQEIRNFAERSYQRTQHTLGALATFTDSLAGMRGRKAILYVSDGLSLRPADALVQAWLNKFEPWALNNSQQQMMRTLPGLNSSEFDTTKEFSTLVARASANRVAFYPLSNAGRVTSSIAANVSGAAISSLGARGIDAGTLETFSAEWSLLTMAEGTGGLAFTRSANIGGLLDRMGRDFESFYSLGYSPTREQDAGFHEIVVKVRRDGAKVRHLKGYRQKDPFENLQDLALSAASTGLEDNALGVRLTSGEQTKSKGDRYQVQVMVQIPFEKLLLLPEAEVHSGRVTVFVVVRDLERSGISTPQRIELPIQVPNSRILETLGQVAAYPLQLDMEKGRKRVSLGVRDNLARIDATVSLEVEVGGPG